MSRMIKLAASLTLLLFVGTAPSASAVGVGVLFVAPFDAPEPTVISSVVDPCTINQPTVEAPTVDPASGTFALRAAVDVGNCVGHAIERLDDWNLGDVPLPLVGMPATIVATFDIENSESEIVGTGGLGASIAVEIAGGRAQTLSSESCSTGGGCARLHKEGIVVLTEQTSALPDSLHLAFRSAASARNATGSAYAVADGVLRAVVIIPHVV